MDKKLEARIARLEKLLTKKNEDSRAQIEYSPLVAGSSFALHVYQAERELEDAIRLFNEGELVIPKSRGGEEKVKDSLKNIEQIMKLLKNFF